MVSLKRAECGAFGSFFIGSMSIVGVEPIE